MLEPTPEATPPLPEKSLALRERVARCFNFALVDGYSAEMRRVAAQVRLAVAVTTPVLLVGEAGTGKRTMARLIHFQSAARELSFAALDATRLPSSALATTLFGARGNRIGTLYLKEPGCLPRELQAKLVELLSKADHSLPRLLAGCGDPVTEVCSGRLLAEFHTVLSPLTITIPPLRERRDDLLLLVERQLARANEDGERVVVGLSEDAWEVVHTYSWPGNLGELFGVLSSARERASGERITAADLPAALRVSCHMAQTPSRPTDRPLPLDKLLEESERRLIQLALKKAGGNKGRAAELLGVFRQRLVRRMEALGLLSSDEAGRSPFGRDPKGSAEE